MRAEQSDANIAESECGTAKLERIMIPMNDDLRPYFLSLRNMSFLMKIAEVIGNQQNQFGDFW
jgi:hypothetical protein